MQKKKKDPNQQTSSSQKAFRANRTAQLWDETQRGNLPIRSLEMFLEFLTGDVLAGQPVKTSVLSFIHKAPYLHCHVVSCLYQLSNDLILCMIHFRWLCFDPGCQGTKLRVLIGGDERRYKKAMRRSKHQDGSSSSGCLGGCSGRLLLHHPPPGLSGDGARSRTRTRSRSGVGVVGTAGLHLVDESFYGGELLGQVAQVSFEGVELLVEIV